MTMLRFDSLRARQRCVSRLGRDLPWSHPDFEVHWKRAKGGFADVTDEEYRTLGAIPGMTAVTDPWAGAQQLRFKERA